MIVVEPVQIARALTYIIVAVVILGTVANVMIYHVVPDPEHKLARLMRRLDLGHEPSLAQWYSSLVLFANALAAGFISLLKAREGARFVGHWRALAILMLYLAIDEAVMIHELFDNTLRDSLETGGLLYFAWVIPGAVFALGVAVGFARFVRHLDARTRVLIVTAGIIFVSGAIGMEMVAGLVMDAHGSEAAGVSSLAHTASQSVEEALEMLGAMLLLYAMLELLRREVGAVHFQIGRRF